MLIEIEAEAVIGAARSRRDIYTQQQRERPRGYARAVAVGDWIWVSGCTSMNAAGEPPAPGDWAAQSELSVETAGRAPQEGGGDPGRRGPTADVHSRRRPDEPRARRRAGLVRQELPDVARLPHRRARAPRAPRRGRGGRGQGRARRHRVGRAGPRRPT